MRRQGYARGVCLAILPVGRGRVGLALRAPFRGGGMMAREGQYRLLEDGAGRVRAGAWRATVEEARRDARRDLRARLRLINGKG